MVELRLDISLAEFLDKDGQNQVLAKIAELLGIDISTIQLRELREGSTIIEFFILTDSESTEENETAN